MKYTVAIIDDCVNDIVKLKDLLQQYNDSSEISFDITTFMHDEYEKLISVEYDLYFLDIDMPNKGGFEIARAIEKIYTSSKIIFCSSKEDLVFQSYGNNTFYFIRKSNINDDVIAAIKKLISVERRNNYFIYDDEKIYYKNIICIKKEKHYIIINLNNNKNYKIRKNIKDVINEFSLNGFIEVDHGVMVNILWINQINSSLKKLILKNNQEIYISERKLKNVKIQYFKYIVED